jgi:dienelactone hydrolase
MVAGAVVVVVEAPAAALVVVVVDARWAGEVGVGDPEPQAASPRPNAGAAKAITNPNCSRRPGFPRMAPVWLQRVQGTVQPMATTRDIVYEADGRTMIGTLALPDDDGTDQRPGVLVCHEGPGLDDHARARAARLADELGYVAFALDYHGDGKPIGDRNEMMSRIGELRSDPARAFAVGTAGLDLLRAEERCDPDRLAAIGFCFGGTLSLELARGGADLKAVVGFHSGLSTVHPEDARNITGKVLALIGADDPMVHADERRAFEDEMRAGGVDWELNVYGGAVHSFTNTNASPDTFPGIAYDEATDRRSWQAMVDLFHEVFG